MTTSCQRRFDHVTRLLTALAGTAIITILGIMIGIGFFLWALPVLIMFLLKCAVSLVMARLRIHLLGEA